MLRKTALVLLTLAYAWVIWRMTLTPQLFSAQGEHLVADVIRIAERHAATDWLTWDRAEFLANVAMFVPVGAIGALWLGRRWWFVAAVLAVALSAGIELTQLVALPSRVADPMDVVANGLGGVAGATCIGILRTMRPGRSRSRRGAAARAAGC